MNIRSVSNRISIAESKTENGSTIWSLVILPYNDKIKLLLMFLWILAWTVSGLIIIASYKIATNQDQKLFIIIFTFFWLYFEWKIITSFLWKKWGKEKLWLKDDLFILETNTLGKKHTISFRKNDINELEIIEFNPKSFNDFISNSFWNKGKPRIKINTLGKNIYFAYQISDEEAKAILKELKKLVK